MSSEDSYLIFIEPAAGTFKGEILLIRNRRDVTENYQKFNLSNEREELEWIMSTIQHIQRDTIVDEVLIESNLPLNLKHIKKQIEVKCGVQVRPIFFNRSNVSQDPFVRFLQGWLSHL